MGLIDLFKNYLYSIGILMLYDSKLFVLRIVTLSYNYLLRIIISYLKLYN